MYAAAGEIHRSSCTDHCDGRIAQLKLYDSIYYIYKNKNKTKYKNKCNYAKGVISIHKIYFEKSREKKFKKKEQQQRNNTFKAALYVYALMQFIES